MRKRLSTIASLVLLVVFAISSASFILDTSKLSPSSGVLNALSIKYCAPPGATDTSGIFPRGFFDCGSGTLFIAHKKKEPQPLSAVSTDSLSEQTCIQLYNAGVGLTDNMDWLASYDSLKKFIENCANNSYPNAPSAFFYMSGDMEQLKAQDTAIWSDYQLWLRSVLYLNTTDPEYFCQCVEQFSPWIYYPPSTNDSIGVLQYDTTLALTYWLLQNTNCDSTDLRRDYEGGRVNQKDLWQQSGESGALDTTLPPIPPGLDSLLERHFLYASVSNPPPPGILSSASASPNPVTSGTVIYFSISKEAYVKIELFDVLGHEVGSAGFESLFEPGNKSVPLSLAGLPSGTYFARIQTAYGEAQSVKLVKQ